MIIYAVAILTASAVLVWPARPTLFSAPRGRKESSRTLIIVDAEQECLHVLDALVAALRAGTPAMSALDVVLEPYVDASAHTAPGWKALQEAARVDGDIVKVWHELGHEWGCPGIENVVTGWQLSARHGFPLADAMATAALGMRARRSQMKSVDAAVAGARATVAVLAFLPVLGSALALALGVNLWARYQGAAGFVCLWPGLFLMWMGRRWVQKMVRSALQDDAVGAS